MVTFTKAHEVRRADDDELVGLVLPEDTRAIDVGANGAETWVPATVFGAALGPACDRETAEATVRERGLSSLAERWWVRTTGVQEWREAWLLEVKPDRIRLRWNDPMLMDTGHGEWITVADVDIRLQRP